MAISIPENYNYAGTTPGATNQYGFGVNSLNFQPATDFGVWNAATIAAANKAAAPVASVAPTMTAQQPSPAVLTDQIGQGPSVPIQSIAGGSMGAYDTAYQDFLKQNPNWVQQNSQNGVLMPQVAYSLWRQQQASAPAPTPAPAPALVVTPPSPAVLTDQIGQGPGLGAPPFTVAYSQPAPVQQTPQVVAPPPAPAPVPTPAPVVMAAPPAPTPAPAVMAAPPAPAPAPVPTTYSLPAGFTFKAPAAPAPAPAPVVAPPPPPPPTAAPVVTPPKAVVTTPPTVAPGPVAPPIAKTPTMTTPTPITVDPRVAALKNSGYSDAQIAAAGGPGALLQKINMPTMTTSTQKNVPVAATNAINYTWADLNKAVGALQKANPGFSVQGIPLSKWSTNGVAALAKTDPNIFKALKAYLPTY